MHEIICLCDYGIEDLAKKEILEITEKTAESKEYGVLKFQGTNEDIIKLNYSSRLLSRILIPLGEFDISKRKEGLIDLEEKGKKILYKTFLKKGQSFAFASDRFGRHDYNSVDINRTLGSSVFSVLGEENIKVDLTYPDVLFRAIINKDKCSIYFDTTGKIELYKRGYRVLSKSSDIRPTLACAMLQFSNWNPKQILLDPFCKAGIIPIESAMMARAIPPGIFRKDKFGFNNVVGFEDYEKIFEKINKKIKKSAETKIFAYDRTMGDISMSKKNAQFADVFEEITFGRFEAEWLDVKFEKNSMDLILTNPPYGYIKENIKDLEKIYKEFFYSANFILKEKGKICFISSKHRTAEKMFKTNNFKSVFERNLGASERNPRIYVIEKCSVQ